MAERAAETSQRGWPRVGQVALFALAYYVSGQLGLLFAPPPGFVSALWPPAGLTLAAALHLGRGGWLVIWATTLLAGSLWSALPQVGPAHAITVIAISAVGSTVRAVLGAHLLRRFGGAEPSLRHTRTVAALVLGAGLLASLASASIGVLVLALAGFVGPLEGPRVWVTWWLADAAGVIIVAPVLLLVLEGVAPRRRTGAGVERLLLATALLLLSATALSGVAGPEYTRLIFALLLPLVVWPAFRLGPLETAVVVVAVAASALAGAALRAGPLAASEPNAQLLLMQVVLIVIATTGLVLAAAGEERRTAMRRLGDTTALLRAVTDGTPDVVFVKDREGRYLSINAAGARYMGRSVDEVVGRTDEDLFGPDMLRQIRTYDRLVLESGEVRTDEYSEPKDGVRRTFLATKGPVRDALGAITGLFGISRDITDRKLERRLLNGILEGTHDVVSAFDLDFRFVAFNQALADGFKTGFGVEVREGARLSDLLAEHPEALARRLSLLGRAFRGEEARETWTLGAEGEARFVDVLASPLRDETGHVIGGALIGRDVTQAEAAAISLRLSQSRFRALSLQAPVGIFESDRHGHCTFVNEAWCALAGLSTEEALGQAWIQSVHHDDLARVVFAWDETVERGRRFRLEYRFLHAGGRVVWVTGAAEPVRDARNQLVGFLGTAADVTERRRAAEALQRTTFALAAANRELESFSYSVSHDLRAPLRGIDGFSRALEEDYGESLDEEARGYILRIRTATQRMGQIIDDLLLLSRVARAEIRRERVDLTAVAREVDAAFRSAEPERGVSFEVEDGLQVQADGRLVRLLLENLLGNAWKYTSRQTGAHVTLGSRQDGGEACFFVHDDGAGFDMAYAHKLFAAFSRLHSSSEFPGSGIGLATVARIVERHGGRVWAHGEVGKGATFSFTLGRTS